MPFDCSLRDRTLLLLKERKLPLLEIHQQTGIGFWWLKAFRNGEIRDPGVTRTQALYEFLAGRKLEV